MTAVNLQAWLTVVNPTSAKRPALVRGRHVFQRSIGQRGSTRASIATDPPGPSTARADPLVFGSVPAAPFRERPRLGPPRHRSRIRVLKWVAEVDETGYELLGGYAQVSPHLF